MADETAILDAPAEVTEVEETPSEATELGTEEPVEESGEETEGEAEGDESEGDGPEETPEDKEGLAPDGRKMPDDIKKSFKALRGIDPESAKKMKGIYWAEQDYRKVFAKPEEAVAARALIDEVGGTEGIQEIHAEREEWRKIDTDFSEGKPEFVKSLAEGNPEAFLKTAPHVINEFATRAPEQYAYYANKVSLNTLASAGISMQTLAGAYQRYEKTNPEAAAVIAEVHNALFGLNEKAAQFEQKRTDPREEQLKQRETQFEQQRRADFETRVADEAEKHLQTKMQPEIDRVINGRKIDPAAMKGYQKMVKDEVMAKLATIPGIEDKIESFYRTGDQKKSLEYITARYNQFLPEAAKVIEPYLRNIAPGIVKKPAAEGAKPTTKSEPGSITLKEMPEWHELDPAWRSRPESTAEMMQGRAVLKNGKKATGWA